MAVINSGSQVPEHPIVDYDALVKVCNDLLNAIGEDVERDGLKDTPRRFANYWKEFIEYEPGKLGTTFETISTNQMVTISGLRVWSLCEHHLLPFWCDISIGYISDNKVLGLSKFARVAHKYAHRLQLQEQLTQQIANEVQLLTGSENVAVHAIGEHLCMIMRGIKTPGKMSSSVMRGVFFDKPEARAEFFRMIEN